MLYLRLQQLFCLWASLLVGPLPVHSGLVKAGGLPTARLAFGPNGGVALQGRLWLISAPPSFFCLHSPCRLGNGSAGHSSHEE